MCQAKKTFKNDDDNDDGNDFMSAIHTYIE